VINETVHIDPDNLNLAADGELANRVLDHTEQNHPDYLADLLRTNGLAEMVRVRINRYKNAMEHLHKARPTADNATLDEIAKDQLGVANPDWAKANALTRHEKGLLKKFRAKHRL
jgi:hypothetical protein